MTRSDGHFVAVRLRAGEDLRESLETAFTATRAPAGFVATCVGSLVHATVRFAGRGEGELVRGPLHIISLGGTLSPDGAHLHLAVARGDGSMVGGHLLPGCPVRATAEVVVGLMIDVSFRRGLDAGTGRRELVISPPE